MSAHPRAVAAATVEFADQPQPSLPRLANRDYFLPGVETPG